VRLATNGGGGESCSKGDSNFLRKGPRRLNSSSGVEKSVRKANESWFLRKKQKEKWSRVGDGGKQKSEQDAEGEQKSTRGGRNGKSGGEGKGWRGRKPGLSTLWNVAAPELRKKLQIGETKNGVN